MGKTTTEIDLDVLEADASLGEPLARVAYAEGMLLGLEATHDEQAYHRSRLSRHQFWLHGAGTIAGLPVSLSYRAADAGSPTVDVSVGVVVGLGMAVDGLGRDMVLDERQCISLNDWLDERSETDLRPGVRDGKLCLRVTARCRPCPQALQPVMARELSNVTDAVAPQRFVDSCALELLLDTVAAASADVAAATPAPWWQPERDATAVEALLTTAEQAALAAADAATAARLRARARLVHAFLDALPAPPPHEEDVEARQRVLATWLERSRILLARIEVAVGKGSAMKLPPTIVNPAGITVNNLVRPLVGESP
jgi:hypothetical protein